MRPALRAFHSPGRRAACAAPPDRVEGGGRCGNTGPLRHGAKNTAPQGNSNQHLEAPMPDNTESTRSATSAPTINAAVISTAAGRSRNLARAVPGLTAEIDKAAGRIAESAGAISRRSEGARCSIGEQSARRGTRARRGLGRRRQEGGRLLVSARLGFMQTDRRRRRRPGLRRRRSGAGRLRAMRAISVSYSVSGRPVSGLTARRRPPSCSAARRRG